MNDDCKLCGNHAGMSYEVQPDKPVQVCPECFGKWAPAELNALLGVQEVEVKL